MSQLILVVDDDSELRNIYRHALERAGYSIIEAANGIEALQAIEAHSPVLVIMDMAMPLMGGKELLEEIRSRPEWDNLPVVIITARPEHEASAEALGATRFLRKPIGPHRVVAMLSELLES